jgi:hypothetical protein
MVGGVHRMIVAARHAAWSVEYMEDFIGRIAQRLVG